MVHVLGRHHHFGGFFAHFFQERIRAFMGYPVAATGGALCLDSRKTYTFGEKDLKILSQFAELAGNHLAGGVFVKRSTADQRLLGSALLFKLGTARLLVLRGL